jgi:hypothetical protein
MAVSLIDGRIGREAIEVSVTVHIPDPDALTAGEDDVERVVVVGTTPLLQSDVFLLIHMSPCG